jgi:nucleolar MIF4G domain-containing protein 1
MGVIEHKRRPRVSLQERLRAQDDAEVAGLERKLGIKKRRLPGSFKTDGLDYLLADLDDEQESETGSKRKVEDSRWLADKRRKVATAEEEDGSTADSDFEGFNDGVEGTEGSEQDLDLDGGHSFDEDDEYASDQGYDAVSKASDAQPRVKENPYTPPSPPVPTTGKYVPPSRRTLFTATDGELELRVRRQAQGLVNKLTQANLLMIVSDIEGLYRQYPRHMVSSAIVDLLLVQTNEPTSLPDTLLILLAGFAAALYRTVGTDFGALLVERLVTSFQEHYAQASAMDLVEETSAMPKQTSNLITFLSELYSLDLIRSKLMFDYVRLLLTQLTELNAELLLRMVRMCGQLLRRDDPLALKDVITVIRQAVTKAGGEEKISVRTKFMIETINDLKNNRARVQASTSAVVADHRTRMKKLLGTLGTRKSGATEPLGVGIDDILNSRRKGKWWLVGASWAGNTKEGSSQDGQPEDKAAQDHESVGSDDGDFIPDVAALAKQNGMNTDVRRAIFAALVLSTDCDDGYARIMRLRLNKHQQREIPAVVMQCAGAEKVYNHYYTLVARRLCSSHKLRWGFQDQAWKLFKRLGEPLFGEVADDDDDEGNEDGSINAARAVNIGKLLGSLVASGAQSLAVLKCLNLPLVQPKTRLLVEHLLVTALMQNRKEGKPTDKLFNSLGNAGLSRGLMWFLEAVVSKSSVPERKEERRILRTACREAEDVLKESSLQSEDLA